MTEFDSVGNDNGFGVDVNNLETAIVRKGWPDVEAVKSVECPRGSFAGFVVNDDRAAARSKGSGVKVEGRIVEAFPRR